MLTRLRSEHGLALPLALAVMLVLSIAIFAVIEFSSANTRNASLNERRQSAKALAEAGVAHGAAFVAQRGPADTTPITPLPRKVVIDGVEVEWRATYIAPYWTVSATAEEKNPTGASAAPVRRTVSANFEWRAKSTAGPWNGLYIGNPASRPLMSDGMASIATPVYARGDVTITQGKYLGSSFQVRGKLTLDTGGTAPSSSYIGSIGASDRAHSVSGTSCSGSTYKSFLSNFPPPCTRATQRVAEFRVRDGCRFNTSDVPTATNCSQTSASGGSTGRIWLTCPNPGNIDPPPACPITSDTSPAYSATLVPADMVLTAPNVPPATYDLGPAKPCASPTGSPPSFSGSGIELMTDSSYSCKSADLKGELSWNFSTKTLTAKGNIYFQNDLILKSKYAGLVGEGNGFIYVGTYLKLEPETALCGVLLTTTPPKCNNGLDASGNPVWNPATATNLISFVVGQNHESAILQSGFDFQGGLYAAANPGPGNPPSPTGGGYLVQGPSNFKGPLVIEGPVEIKNAGTIDAYAPSNAFSSSSTEKEFVLVPGSWRG